MSKSGLDKQIEEILDLCLTIKNYEMHDSTSGRAYAYIDKGGAIEAVKKLLAQAVQEALETYRKEVREKVQGKKDSAYNQLEEYKGEPTPIEYKCIGYHNGMVEVLAILDKVKEVK